MKRFVIFLISILLMVGFAHSQNFNYDGSKFKDQIESCEGTCTTNDDLMIETGSNTVSLDTGDTGYCGKAGYSSSSKDFSSIDQINVKADVDASYWGGKTGIKIGGKTVWSKDPSGSPIDRTFEESIDVSNYGEDTSFQIFVEDTSKEYCNMFDHTVQADYKIDYERKKDKTGPKPVCDECSTPIDPDNDGLYEDVNGDEKTTVEDAEILAENIEYENGVKYFDFDKNDRFSFSDPVALKNEINGSQDQKFDSLNFEFEKDEINLGEEIETSLTDGSGRTVDRKLKSGEDAILSLYHDSELVARETIRESRIDIFPVSFRRNTEQFEGFGEYRMKISYSGNGREIRASDTVEVVREDKKEFEDLNLEIEKDELNLGEETDVRLTAEGENLGKRSVTVKGYYNGEEVYESKADSSEVTELSFNKDTDIFNGFGKYRIELSLENQDLKASDTVTLKEKENIKDIDLEISPNQVNLGEEANIWVEDQNGNQLDDIRLYLSVYHDGELIESDVNEASALDTTSVSRDSTSFKGFGNYRFEAKYSKERYNCGPKGQDSCGKQNITTTENLSVKEEERDGTNIFDINLELGSNELELGEKTDVWIEDGEGKNLSNIDVKASIYYNGAKISEKKGKARDLSSIRLTKNHSNFQGLGDYRYVVSFEQERCYNSYDKYGNEEQRAGSCDVNKLTDAETFTLEREQNLSEVHIQDLAVNERVKMGDEEKAKLRVENPYRSNSPTNEEFNGQVVMEYRKNNEWKPAGSKIIQVKPGSDLVNIVFTPPYLTSEKSTNLSLRASLRKEGEEISHTETSEVRLSQNDTDTTKSTFKLQEGWNTISSSRLESKDIAVQEGFYKEDIVDDCKLESLQGHKVWSLENGEWTHPSSIGLTEGVLVNSPEACEVEIEETWTSGNPEEPWKQLEQGWNIISVKEEKPLSEVSGDCQFTSVDGSKIHGLTGNDWETFETSEDLNPMKSYYVNTENSCTLGSSSNSDLPTPGQNPEIGQVTGFTGSDLQVTNFGINNENGLALELQASSTNSVTVKDIEMSSENQAKTLSFKPAGNNKIKPGSDKSFNIPNVKGSDKSNQYNVSIKYDTGNLSDITVRGAIRGNIKIE